MGERDRRKFRFIEDFLGYEVRKGELPSELGGMKDETTHESKPQRSDHRGKGRRDKVQRAKKKDKETVQAPETQPQAETQPEQPKAAGPRKKRYYRPKKKPQLPKGE